MNQCQSRSCQVCTEPESLCRCDETPALKLARKLVSEADGTYSRTVTIKHGDFLTLCERAYAWANDQSAAILGKSALSETAKPAADVDYKSMVNAWVGVSRDTARKLGLPDDESKGSTHDWRYISEWIEKRATPSAEALPNATRDTLDEAADRFLAWPLPKDFAPDCGISFQPVNHPNSWPIGTNLFTADQAKAMLKHVLCTVAQPSTLSDLDRELEREFVRGQIRELRNLFGGRETPFYMGFEQCLEEIECRLNEAWGADASNATKATPSSIAPTKGAGCLGEGCPPNQVCDYCQTMTEAEKAAYWFDLYLEETTKRRALERQSAPSAMAEHVHCSYEAKYMELIMAVGRKYPGETRHQTAMRYIQQAEAPKPSDSIPRVDSTLPRQEKP